MPKEKSSQISVSTSQESITIASFDFFRSFNAIFNKWLKNKHNADFLFDWQCMLYSGCMATDTVESGMFYSLANSILKGHPNKEAMLDDPETLAFIQRIIQNHPIYRANVPNAQIGTNDPDIINTYLMSQLSGAVLEAVNNPSEKIQASVLRSYFAMTTNKTKD